MDKPRIVRYLEEKATESHIFWNVTWPNMPTDKDKVLGPPPTRDDIRDIADRSREEMSRTEFFAVFGHELALTALFGHFKTPDEARQEDQLPTEVSRPPAQAETNQEIPPLPLIFRR